MTDEPTLSRLVVVGASHRTSSEATRDRLFIAEENLPAFLQQVAVSGFAKGVALSTCARTEIFGLVPDIDSARTGALRILEDFGGFETGELGPQVYLHHGEAALRHLFRVAASLESPIVGEPEVTGQFRDAVRLADAHDLVGPALDGIVQAANRAAKRVRSETPIGERPVSMAACATQVAREVQGELSRSRAILVTGGEMGELITDQLCAAGLSQLTVIARSRARAEISARRYDCHHAVLEDLPGLLQDADIVVTSLGAGQRLFDPALAGAALVARRLRPMLFVDAAIPSDVDPAINDLDGAFVYSLDDLERIAADGRSRRDEAASGADRIIDEEVEAFVRARTERGAVPAVSSLRSHFEQVRREILAETGANDPALDESTRRLVNRLLHAPSETLRKLAAEDGDASARAEELLRRLFRIESSDENTKE